MKIDREQVRRRMLRQEIQTFSELADKLGISRQALSAWFKGGPFASTSLAALCRILQCTPNDILILEDGPNAMAPVTRKAEPEFSLG
jgi:DNA-binding Xre family transcriptional regulator